MADEGRAFSAWHLGRLTAFTKGEGGVLQSAMAIDIFFPHYSAFKINGTQISPCQMNT